MNSNFSKISSCTLNKCRLFLQFFLISIVLVGCLSTKPVPECSNQEANADARIELTWPTLGSERSHDAMFSERRPVGVVGPHSAFIYKINSCAFVAGQAYSVRVTVEKSESSEIAIVFRLPESGQSFRTYKTPINPDKDKPTVFYFVAPDFNKQAELAILNNGRTELKLSQISITKVAPLSLTEPIADKAHSFVPPGYTLTFNDEFNGVSLNRSKWFTRYIYDNENLDHLKEEKQRYRDNDNHVVTDGVLRLVARRTDDNSYESGMIRSDWTTQYGYFEARVKMPKGRGAFPAFWLNSDVSSNGVQMWPPEIDIFEFVNNGVEDLPNMLHFGVIEHGQRASVYLFTNPNFDKKWSFWRASFQFDEGWHTIGTEWNQNTVSSFVDGIKIAERSYDWKYVNGEIAGKAHVILNLAIGDEWAGRNGVDDERFPMSFEIDWIRVYKKDIN